jgi:hypothetical protein
MILSKKNNKPNHPPLKMNNSELQKVDNHKHLGVIFSNNGFWHDHHVDIGEFYYILFCENKISLWFCLLSDSFSHLVSSYNLLSPINLVPPVTILAASS